MTTIPPIIRGHPIWTVRKYLHWPEMRLIEFDDGVVTELPTPTVLHQIVVFNLMCQIDSFVEKHRLGMVVQCPFPIKTGHRRFREPDVSFQPRSARKTDPATTYFWDEVEFVAEVLADETKERRRDLIDKRREYADAGIPEYWIVDPKQSTITVLELNGGKYQEAGSYGLGDTARSTSLRGMQIPVAKVFKR